MQRVQIGGTAPIKGRRYAIHFRKHGNTQVQSKNAWGEFCSRGQYVNLVEVD